MLGQLCYFGYKRMLSEAMIHQHNDLKYADPSIAEVEDAKKRVAGLKRQ
jgi:hypothetical protein